MTPETAQQLATGWARDSGHTLTTEALATVADRIATMLDRDASGFSYCDEAFGETFRIENNEAVAVPVGEFIADLMRRHGKPIAPAKPATDLQDAPTPAATPRRPRRVEYVSAIGEAIQAQHDAEMVKATMRMKNPWLPGQINLTNQNIIKNKNPGLAARFKAQAGV